MKKFAIICLVLMLGVLTATSCKEKKIGQCSCTTTTYKNGVEVSKVTKTEPKDNGVCRNSFEEHGSDKVTKYCDDIL